ALLFVLVPSFGIYGGAWATFFAYAVSAGILWRISIKVYPLPYEWHRLLGTGIITIMLFALSNMVQFNAIMNGMLLIAFPIILFSTGILNTQEKQFIKRVLGNNS
ncbi:MAG: polysaccharide biosynthesis C-terminal domain-containing protein, partial [Candidatus Kapaibacteriota bacterium]